MSLYEISKRYSGLVSMVEDGSLSTDYIADTLEGVEGEFKEKAIAVAKFGENLLVAAEAKKQLAKKLNEEAKVLENKHIKLIDYLDDQMKCAGITEISCDYFKIKYRKLPDIVDITDIESLPVKFTSEKVTVSVDKIALKKALEDGLVDGAQLISGRKKLEIK